MSGLEPSTHSADHSAAAAGATTSAYLLVLEGMSSVAIDLPMDDDVVIGRGEGAQVRLVEPSISCAHARISRSGGCAEIVDLGSQNGTKVNGERLVGARPLLSGDVITILGATLVFHAAPRPAARRQVVTFESLRQRIEDECDRTARSSRSFALVAISLAAPAPEGPPILFDPIGLARVIEPVLRRTDVLALAGTELLALLPETDVVTARDLAHTLVPLLRAGAPFARAGLALAPTDGNELDLLLAGARAARDRAAPGGVELGAPKLSGSPTAAIRYTARGHELARAGTDWKSTEPGIWETFTVQATACTNLVPCVTGWASRTVCSSPWLYYVAAQGTAGAQCAAGVTVGTTGDTLSGVLPCG